MIYISLCNFDFLFHCSFIYSTCAFQICHGCAFSVAMVPLSLFTRAYQPGYSAGAMLFNWYFKSCSLIFTYLFNHACNLYLLWGSRDTPFVYFWELPVLFSLIHDHKPKLWSPKDLSFLHTLFHVKTNQLFRIWWQTQGFIRLEEEPYFGYWFSDKSHTSHTSFLIEMEIAGVQLQRYQTYKRHNDKV